MRAHGILLLLFGMVVPAFGLVFFGAADAAEFPKQTGRVVDEAGILSESFERRLTDELRQHRKAMGDQVVVVTVAALSGRKIELFGRDLGNYWRLGRGNGERAVLLIVAPKEKRVRIEVARGLRGVLTDEIAQDIFDRDILPDFRVGDYERSILMGIGGVLHALEQGRVEREDSGRSMETILVLIVVLGILIVLVAIIRSDVFKANTNHPVQSGFDDSDYDLDNATTYSGGSGSFDGGGASGGNGH